MKYVISQWLLIAALAGAVRPSPAATLPETFAKMDKAASTLTSLSADLRRVSHTNIIDKDSIDTGTMLLKRPKPHEIKMLLNTNPPDPKQVFVDGKEVRIFYPNSLLEQRYDMRQYKSLLEQFLMLGFGSTSKDLQQNYTVALGGSDTIAGMLTTRLELVPKSADMLKNVRRVELWLSDETGLPVQQKFYEPSGDYQVATYTNIKVNPKLPDLNLETPKGTKVEYPLK